MDTSQAGMTFKAIVDDPVMIGGSTVIPRNASAVLQAVHVAAVWKSQQGQRQNLIEADVDWIWRQGLPGHQRLR